MTSVVRICNLALMNIGENGTVASIDPPEGSANAGYLADYYPLARDSLLEMHRWSFASRRKKLAEVNSVSSAWRYCYAAPNDMLSAVSVLADDAIDDNYSMGIATPQQYILESLDDGSLIVRTDQENALLRYQARVVDSNTFPSLFVTTLSWHLASMVAGTIIKGAEGAAEGKRCAEMMNYWLVRAIDSDSSQRKVKLDVDAPWITGR